MESEQGNELSALFLLCSEFSGLCLLLAKCNKEQVDERTRVMQFIVSWDSELPEKVDLRMIYNLKIGTKLTDKY